MREALAEVAQSGAPAQQKLAQRLLATDLAEAEAVRTATELIDAFRHDPYLTRNPGD
ncbi:MAG: hypothetical protein K0U62_04230 [Actinomycetia bacterium]|nr:hypothetical protein [Actinomycetes bacterium]